MPKIKEMNQTRSNIFIGIALIVLAAILKVAAYYNVLTISPIIAIALFSGAVIKDKKLAFIIPLLAMFIADCLMEVFKVGQGFYGFGQIANYICLLAVALLGSAMRKISVLSVIGFSLGSTLLFFFLSNSAVFLFDDFNMYENTVNGYVKCMAAGLAFLKPQTFINDLLWSGVLFGSYVLYFKPSGKKVIA